MEDRDVIIKVEFTGEELDKILEYMEKVGAETVQEAVIHAVTKNAD